MKITLTLLLVTAIPALAVPEDYVNFVRQVQEDSGVEWDVSVAPRGEMLSPEGVGSLGSLYELWSVHSGTGHDYLLDEEFVSAFTPEAVIMIETLDPYDVVPRTRVDQPFTVTFDVGGLLVGADLPLQARQVLITHEAFAYPDGHHGFPGNQSREGEMVEGFHLDENGLTSVRYPMTSIAGEDLTKVEGEEEFTAYAVSETGAGIEVLDSALVQVWPMAGAEIRGIVSGQSYEDLPPVQVGLRDLYPDSETFLRIHKGAPGVGTDMIEVSDSYVLIDDVVPQDRLVTLNKLGRLLPDEGAYTFEIIHTTPFGTELLDQVYPVVIDRTLEVRGTLYANE